MAYGLSSSYFISRTSGDGKGKSAVSLHALLENLLEHLWEILLNAAWLQRVMSRAQARRSRSAMQQSSIRR